MGCDNTRGSVRLPPAACLLAMRSLFTLQLGERSVGVSSRLEPGLGWVVVWFSRCPSLLGIRGLRLDETLCGAMPTLRPDWVVPVVTG